MENENSLQRMMNGRAKGLPEEIEHNIVHQAGTFSVFSRVVELFGPNALDIASSYICGHIECDPKGPKCAVDEEVPFWRVKP